MADFPFFLSPFFPPLQWKMGEGGGLPSPFFALVLCLSRRGKDPGRFSFFLQDWRRLSGFFFFGGKEKVGVPSSPSRSVYGIFSVRGGKFSFPTDAPFSFHIFPRESLGATTLGRGPRGPPPFPPPVSFGVLFVPPLPFFPRDGESIPPFRILLHPGKGKLSKTPSLSSHWDGKACRPLGLGRTSFSANGRLGTHFPPSFHPGNHFFPDF